MVDICDLKKQLYESIIYMQKNTLSAQNTQIFSTQIQKYYQHQLNTPVQPLPRLITNLISHCIDKFCLFLHCTQMESCTVRLCVWIPSFSTVCEIELYYYSFILFAFQYSVVETYHLRSFTAHVPSDICFAILHYECSGTCPLVAVCVYDGYIQAFLLALGPKVYTLNFKCQLSKMIINWQHHQQCRLPVAYFLAKT